MNPGNLATVRLPICIAELTGTVSPTALAALPTSSNWKAEMMLMAA